MEGLLGPEEGPHLVALDPVVPWLVDQPIKVVLVKESSILLTATEEHLVKSDRLGKLFEMGESHAMTPLAGTLHQKVLFLSHHHLLSHKVWVLEEVARAVFEHHHLKVRTGISICLLLKGCLNFDGSLLIRHRLKETGVILTTTRVHHFIVVVVVLDQLVVAAQQVIVSSLRNTQSLEAIV